MGFGILWCQVELRIRYNGSQKSGRYLSSGNNRSGKWLQAPLRSVFIVLVQVSEGYDISFNQWLLGKKTGKLILIIVTLHMIFPLHVAYLLLPSFLSLVNSQLYFIVHLLREDFLGLIGQVKHSYITFSQYHTSNSP